MSDKRDLPGVIVAFGSPDKVLLDRMTAITVAWTLRAARGECGWVCADCCQSFPAGMPDECCCGHQSCTDIIARDKRDAFAEQPDEGNHRPIGDDHDGVR
ncbi:hypothetical protein [Paraburkholderia tropica]|uniref:hypothetical protein n=1 Tax=Paraburkholderia tropica TaxID=92647 RepID=UPI0016142A2F|nr:hypothetical protein [Paraburkholderia tropica]MBB6319277.1 hypothetical protein [Paraburkholderia tropica]